MRESRISSESRKIPTWIFDMDGTLSDSSGRVHYLRQEKRDWGAFFRRAIQDPPHQGVCRILQLLHQAGDRVLIFSGRSEAHRHDTLLWLRKHCFRDLPVPELSAIVTLRPDGNRQDDDILKISWIQEFLRENPDHEIQAIFDDRPRIVNAYRKHGFLVLDPGTWEDEA